MEIFNIYLQEFKTIGILHIAHTEHYREIVDAALANINDHTLIIVEDIDSSNKKHEWWKEMQESEFTGITYDLESTGLIFFDRSRYKNTYWIDFKK